jgi:CO/xanthine dehydrogenase FAD-binding subunit
MVPYGARGIYRVGRYLIIGLETAPADIAHSHLIRQWATCLAEVCRHDEIGLRAHLVDGLTTGGLSTLALAALQGELFLPQAESRWTPLAEVLSTAPEHLRAATAVRLPCYDDACGSAFVIAPAVRGIATTLQAVAASVRLDREHRLVRAVGLALLPRCGSIVSTALAETVLRGQPVTVAAIAQAAQAVQAQTQEMLGPGMPSSAFPVPVTAHLVRKALDRAAARALAMVAA